MQEIHTFRLEEQENCVCALLYFDLDGKAKKCCRPADM